MDTTIALAEWLRGELPGVPVYVGGAGSEREQVVVSRIGGGEEASLVAADVALLQIDVWGDNSHTVTATRKESVRRALSWWQGTVTVGTPPDTTVILGPTVLAERWLPDPDTGRPRFALTVQVPAVTGD